MAVTRIGKFQILETLGAGANSSILRVRRAEDGIEYALKIISLEDEDDKKYLDQAKHEFRVSEMLNHPNLIKVHAFETESDWRFRVKKAKLLVEYVPGKTLDKVKTVAIPKLLKIFEQVAAGVTHMHARGVFHADLKPNNVMLGRTGVVKVIDYGLAWIKGEPKDRVQGTPEYMAPETLTHKLVNERTDIYNLGATMYRLATMQLPPKVLPQIEGVEMDEATFQKALKPVRDCNKGCPPEVEAIILKCLSFSALKRPERMSEVQGELDKLCDKYAADTDLAGFVE
jgi:serine/threonine protein kinase